VRSFVSRSLALTILGTALLAVSACGGGDDDDDGGGGPALPGAEATATSGGSGPSPASGDPTRSAGNVDARDGSCNVRITGDVEHEFTAPGGSSAVGADYFMSKDEIRRALEFLGDKPTDAELEDDVVDLILLIVNCTASNGDYSLSFYPGGESTYSDVPFGPKEYVISPGGVLGAAGKGEMGVLATIGDLTLAVSEPGEFNITEWDDDRIEGNFAVTMTEPELFATGTPKTVHIEGDFNYRAP